MKRFISVILVLAFAATMFSACSSNKKDDSKSTTATQQSLDVTYDSHYDSMDDSTLRAYKSVADAISKGQKSVLFNLQMLDNVNQLINTSFPLMVLVDNINVNSSKNGVDITYKNSTEEHLSLVSAFNSKVQGILKECGKDTVKKNEYMLNVYTYVATHETIDNSCLTVYDAIMKSKGISSSISGMFEYLLLLGGVSAYHVHSYDAGNNIWFYTQSKINDVTYNFDVTSETGINDGKGLVCFAMTDSDLKKQGISKETMYADKSKAAVCKDKRFSALRSCRQYTVSGDIITAALYTGKSETIDMTK